MMSFGAEEDLALSYFRCIILIVLASKDTRVCMDEDRSGNEETITERYIDPKMQRILIFACALYHKMR
jgi:hypothetical protein